METRHYLRRSYATSNDTRQRRTEKAHAAPRQEILTADVHVWVQGVRVTWSPSLLCTSFSAPNGLRYPLVGGTR